MTQTATQTQRTTVRRGAFAVSMSAAWCGVLLAAWGRGIYVPLAALSLIILAIAVRTEVLRASWTPTWTRVGLGAAFGVALVLATHGMYPIAVDAFPWIAPEVRQLYTELHQWPGKWLGLPLVIPVVAAEEVLYRGVVVDLLAPYGAWAAILGAPLLYGGVELATGSYVLAFVAFALGLVWTLERLILRDLVSTFATHLVWTVCLMFIWPVEVLT